MTRILKTLGLAVSALAALVAVMAPAAQAETGALTTEEFPSIVTGPQVGGITFDIGAGPLTTVTCSSKLDATLVGPGDPVTFTPTYAGCTAEPGGLPATVTTNGCDYRIGFSRPGTTQMPETTGAMQASIFCPDGQIEIHIYENVFAHAENNPVCTYDIGPQGPVAGGTYHNVAGMPSDVLATVRASFTAQSTMGPEFVCGGVGMMQHLPITLTGNYTLRGFQDAGGGEGAQIPLHVG